MSTLTPNYDLIKPTPGGDIDTWGPMLNTDMDIIDAQMKSNSNAANAMGIDPSTGQYIWDDAVAMSDPGSGKARGNAATTNTITQYAVSTTGRFGGTQSGVRFSAGDVILLTNGPSTGLAISGASRFRINTATFNATWWLLDVDYIAGNINLADASFANFAVVGSGENSIPYLSLAHSIIANASAAAAHASDLQSQLAYDVLSAPTLTTLAWGKLFPASLLNSRDFLNTNPNGDFELGDLAWTRGTSWTIVNDPANAMSGNWEAQATNAGVVTAITTNNFGAGSTCVPGENIYAEAWVKTSAGYTAANGRIQISFYDKDGGLISSLNVGTNFTTAQTSYVLSSGLAVAPALAAMFTGRFIVTTQVGTLYLDSLRTFRRRPYAMMLDDVMAANTLRGNNTGAPAQAVELTAAQVNTLLGTTPTGVMAGTRVQATSSTLLLTDVGKEVHSSGVGTTQTIDTVANTLWPDSCSLVIINTAGSGTTTIAAAAGVAIRSPTGITGNIQLPAFGTCILFKNGVGNTWYAFTSPAVAGFTEYDKGAYAISTAYTQAHGLGARPSQAEVWLECTTTNLGYAVGDRVKANILVAAGGAIEATLMTNTTNVVFRTGNSSPGLIDTSFAGSNITPASWKVIFRIS